MPGGSVVIQVWGRHEACDLDAIKPIVRPYFPGADPNAPPPPDLAEPGVLEGIASAAGLEPKTTFDVSWAYVYRDDDELTRSLLSAAGVGDAAGEREDGRPSRPDRRRSRRSGRPDGSYALENEWHFLVAAA